MATYTAQILIGENHPNHGGLLPLTVSQMFLSENSTPQWSLYLETHPAKGPASAVWVPEKPETILEDAFLMVAYYIVREEWVLAMLGRYLAPDREGPLNLNEGVGHEDLERARSSCRENSFKNEIRAKLVVVPFQESSVLDQLKIIGAYGFDCEVLMPRFTRLHSRWEGRVVTKGSLE